jgi:hypothetical protein
LITNDTARKIRRASEFKALVQRIAALDGLMKYFGNRHENTQEEPEINNPCWGCIRLSHQGNNSMKTWNTKAKWLQGHYGSTARQKELKLDLMRMVVEDVEEQRPGKARRVKARSKFVRPAKPQTILPPPNDWKPTLMDKCFPIVECKEPVWEYLDLFWECKRNSQALNHAKVYIDCALKAAEALRYQWSRRYICCVLHSDQ